MKKKVYDVAIIGAGPAGLMAAITAARAGAQVVLLEKNNKVGKKLSITGGGRCNITNNNPNVRELLSAYKEAGKYLFSPFAKFGVAETLSWFSGIGVKTIEEGERRVFPESQSAVAVTKALLDTAGASGVVLKTNVTVDSIGRKNDCFVVDTKLNEPLFAKTVVVATGGVSRPETGSTGDAFPWLTSFGHTIKSPETALVPIVLKQNELTRRLSGVALPNVGVSIIQDGKVFDKKKGKALFTHRGMSGPVILNMSSKIGELLTTGEVELKLDFVPQIASDELESILLSRLIESPNKLIRNQWQEILLGALVVPVLEQAGVAPSTPSHSITVEMRRKITNAVKGFSLDVSHLLSEDFAIVSSGGVVLPEIDFRTMESRLVAGLYVVGDMLNINRPSGGYSLQLCWTTGYVAGQSAALKARDGNDKNNDQ